MSKHVEFVVGIQEPSLGAPEFPRFPDHEVTGVGEEVGAGLIKWKIGDHVGLKKKD
ncbi:hypothetical protein ACOSZE_06745 [Lysinibacillus fusiformis]|uniref:hypothetical protein n=1 Tax=Lysinibacillus fusiformis TaxID=28031 RepID=UPI003BA1F06F